MDALWPQKGAAEAEAVLFDKDKWDAMVANETRDTLGGIAVEGGKLGAKKIGMEVALDVTNPKVEEFLTTHSFKFAQKINQTAADNLRGALTEGLNAGEGIQTLRKRILREVPQFSVKKQRFYAEMVARTEAARAQSAGAQEVWRKSGVVEAKEWSAAPGACKFCAKMNGRRVSLTETYFPQGGELAAEDGSKMTFTYGDIDHPPAHPNCRCAIVPVLIEKVVAEAPASEAVKFTPAKSVKEAVKWTEDNVADWVGFQTPKGKRNISLVDLNAINKYCSEAIKRYNLPKLDRIGWQKEVYKVTRNTAFYVRNVVPGSGKARHAICFNKSALKKWPEESKRTTKIMAERFAQGEADSPYWVVGNFELDATVRHEMGHYLFRVNEESVGKKWRSAVDAFLSTSTTGGREYGRMARKVSEYAPKNTKELFAEVHSAILRGESQRIPPTLVSWHNEATGG